DSRARLLSLGRVTQLVAVVARTYARALFEAAKEQGRVDEVRDELGTLVETVREVPELQAMIRNPRVVPPGKADALGGILKGAEELLRNFVRVVAEKGRAPMLEEIAREFDALVSAEERILNVELTTAYELSDEEASSIGGQIDQAVGRPVAGNPTPG